MTHSFNCIATGIGSLPITDPDKAADLSVTYLPEAPIWPQLPQKDFREHMDSQYSESLPGLRLNEAKERFFFDTSKDLTPELEKFFERYIEKDYGFFKISEDYAAGFYAFLRALKKGLPTGARFVKMNRLAALMPSCGSACVSSATISTGRPAMPPASFTSLAPIRMLVSKSLP